MSCCEGMGQVPSEMSYNAVYYSMLYRNIKTKIMNISAIQEILIDKGYYADDHAISNRCIKDIVNAYNKSERIRAKKKAKKK